MTHRNRPELDLDKRSSGKPLVFESEMRRTCWHCMTRKPIKGSKMTGGKMICLDCQGLKAKKDCSNS